jgi:hypothetical protein
VSVLFPHVSNFNPRFLRSCVYGFMILAAGIGILNYLDEGITFNKTIRGSGDSWSFTNLPTFLPIGVHYRNKNAKIISMPFSVCRLSYRSRILSKSLAQGLDMTILSVYIYNRPRPSI